MLPNGEGIVKIHSALLLAKACSSEQSSSHKPSKVDFKRTASPPPLIGYVIKPGATTDGGRYMPNGFCRGMLGNWRVFATAKKSVILPQKCSCTDDDDIWILVDCSVLWIKQSMITDEEDGLG